MMVGFIDDHRRVYGVESIRAVLPIAPSTYFRHKAQEADPTRRSARAQRDEELRAIIRRIWTRSLPHHAHSVHGMSCPSPEPSDNGRAYTTSLVMRRPHPNEFLGRAVSRASL